ncbi:dihydrofolate reductase family protein [Reichenbachiella versicolor]|uniref:dihydrofolate reductase family protein n=1 Tax=Reichenbachiella versicolor TaxID=1821036 RepID=UPI000D6E898F|nr:dihydrofolate reductase family protein [Reichenbachiella versicolor]
MKKIKLYIAISINGKIAKKNGDVDWLENIPNPDNEDYGYTEFVESCDSTIMGMVTHQQILGFDVAYPYRGMKNYVITRNQNPEPFEHVEFVTSNHIDFIKSLKQQNGKDIWLIGGGQINTLLLANKLIDQIYLYYMPYILENGHDIFEYNLKNVPLKLISNRTFQSGAMEAVYDVV